MCYKLHTIGERESPSKEGKLLRQLQTIKDWCEEKERIFMLCGWKDNVFIYAFVVVKIFGNILGSWFGSFCSLLFYIIFLSLSKGALWTDHNTDELNELMNVFWYIIHYINFCICSWNCAEMLVAEKMFFFFYDSNSSGMPCLFNNNNLLVFF